MLNYEQPPKTHSLQFQPLKTKKTAYKTKKQNTENYQKTNPTNHQTPTHQTQLTNKKHKPPQIIHKTLTNNHITHTNKPTNSTKNTNHKPSHTTKNMHNTHAHTINQLPTLTSTKRNLLQKTLKQT